jgi:hypothetical protein
LKSLGQTLESVGRSPISLYIAEERRRNADALCEFAQRETASFPQIPNRLAKSRDGWWDSD